jgi:lipoprotein NlpD
MILNRMRYSAACLLLTLLSGCSSGPVNAPVDSRGHRPQAAAPPPKPVHAPIPAKRTVASDTASHYVVRRGDTLFSIAWQHGVKYQQLAAINGIRYPYTIYSGQRLRLRPAAAERATAPVKSAAAAASPAEKPQTRPASRPVTKPVVKPVPASVSRPAAPAPAATIAREYDGKWVWPTRGRLLRRFQPNSTGKKGIDIGGHNEQPVKAAANGKVVYVGSGLVGYGRLIIVKHNENLLSAYGHNSKLLVTEGEHVTAGQMIAKMGSSGTNRTGLYFEIRKDGKPVNPLQYLPKK